MRQLLTSYGGSCGAEVIYSYADVINKDALWISSYLILRQITFDSLS
jgi:hypothetical protein